MYAKKGLSQVAYVERCQITLKRSKCLIIRRYLVSLTLFRMGFFGAAQG